MMNNTIGKLCAFLKKSSIQAGEGKKEGKYPFYTTSESAELYTDFYQYEGDSILIGIGGKATCRFVTGKFSSSMHNYVLQAKEMLDPKYLMYFLKKDDLSILNDGFRGTGLKCIKKDYIEKIEVPLVSKIDQKRIVAELDKLSSIIEEDKKQINSLDSLIVSKYHELFGDPVENEKNWKTCPLSTLGNCKNGMNFRNDDKGLEINCLGVGDFKNNSFCFSTNMLPKVSLNELPSDDYLLKNGDIVFVRSNGNKDLVGRSILVFPNDIKTTFSGFCIRFRLNSKLLLPIYLLYFFKDSNVRIAMRGRGANIQNLNQKILSSLVVPIPSIEAQKEFESFVLGTYELKKLLEKHLCLMTELFDKKADEFFGGM